MGMEREKNSGNGEVRKEVRKREKKDEKNGRCDASSL